MTAVATQRAAIYCRLATASQDPDTLDAQEAACRRYAAERGHAVDEAHVYREIAGGLRLTDRPRFAELRAAIQRGEIGIVIAERPDRLTRDLTTFATIVAECEQAGAALAFGGEG
jgi:site-specific DNA recombinase